MCSWPDVMSFLDKAHHNLPAKVKRGDDKGASRTGSANTVDRTLGLNSPTSRAKPPSTSGSKRQAASTSFSMSAPLAKQLVKHAFQKAGIKTRSHVLPVSRCVEKYNTVSRHIVKYNTVSRHADKCNTYQDPQANEIPVSICVDKYNTF